MNLLRPVSLLALVSYALSASALDAFSNLAPGPDAYRPSYYLIGSNFTQGFQFTSGLNGTLAGFQVAMNDLESTGAFSLTLYADDGTDRLGSMLGTYGGTSTGISSTQTRSALANVAAAGAAVELASGAKYWLVASGSSPNQLAWNDSYGPKTSMVYQNGNYDPSSGSYSAAAFSVQVAPSASPAVPGPLAALPFALMVLGRRRRA